VAHPGASYKACRNAVRAAGHVGVSREDVAEVARALHASSATKRKTTRGATTSRSQAQTEKYHKHVPKPEKPSDVIDFKVKYCESCSGPMAGAAADNASPHHWVVPCSGHAECRM
jgi:hypothetical protein